MTTELPLSAGLMIIFVLLFNSFNAFCSSVVRLPSIDITLGSSSSILRTSLFTSSFLLLTGFVDLFLTNDLSWLVVPQNTSLICNFRVNCSKSFFISKQFPEVVGVNLSPFLSRLIWLSVRSWLERLMIAGGIVLVAAGVAVGFSDAIAVVAVVVGPSFSHDFLWWPRFL